MDLDAAAVAAKLGKPVRYLESIDEHIAAVEAVPVERFAHFLSSGDGNLDGLAAGAQDFPAYCEPLIGQRDAVLAHLAQAGFSSRSF